jgi:hypothetical protein
VVRFEYEKAWQRRLICQAGFGTGLLAGLALSFAGPRAHSLAYQTALALHFLAYPWTALDGANDFDGLAGVKDGGKEEG